MVDQGESLEDAWTYLEEGPRDGGMIATRPLRVSSAHGSIRAAMDSAGVRHLLVPVATADAVVSDRISKGVVVVPQRLEVDGNDAWFADLVCVDPSLSDVYAQLAGAVCERVEAAPAVAGSACAELLIDWRELLTPQTQMGRQIAVGLFGELQILRELVRQTGPAAFSVWVGPEGHVHDLVGSGVAIEVKSTETRNGRRVEVHGVEQLDSEEGVDLHLQFFRIIADPEGESLEDLAQSLAELGVPYKKLMQRMSSGGYGKEGNTDPLRFRVLESDLYVVDDSFPALTRASFSGGLPRGIERITYVADLAAATPGPLGEAQRAGVLGRLGALT